MDAARQLDHDLPRAVTIFLDQQDVAVVRERNGGDPIGLLDDMKGRQDAAVGQLHGV